MIIVMDRNIMTCECCGGQLVIVERDNRLWQCLHCRAIVPAKVLTSDNITQLLNIANATRCALKFSDAINLYKQIINDNEFCSEAYWGMVLSKLGIEYVKDTDGKYIPTCHRASFNSILKDKDYLKALETAVNDDIRKDYIKKAEIIEEIRIKLLELAKKDKNYDIFICFKATQEIDGKKYPTKDSELAQKIYHHFDKIGYEVFFSNISLESLIGENYEPHIFSALNSSQVMLLICFNSDYVESTWIKNEWTRFLELINNGEKKQNALIPIVKDVEISSLPFELQKIEALNIDTNIHWLKTLEDHVESLVLKTKTSIVRQQVKKQEFKKSAKSFTQVKKATRNIELKGQLKVEPDIELKLSIGYKFLNRNDFNHARKQFEKIIKDNQNISQAYWGLMLSKLKHNDEDIIKNINTLENYKDFENAINNSVSEEQAKKYLDIFKESVYVKRNDYPIDKLIIAINKYMEWEDINAITFEESFIYKFIEVPFELKSIELFDALKKYIPESEVDFYINYLIRFADFCLDIDVKTAVRYYDEVLAIEKDNTLVMWKKYRVKNPKLKLNPTLKKQLNSILEYGFSNDLIIEDLFLISTEKIKNDPKNSAKLFELAVSWIPIEQNKTYSDYLYNYAIQLNNNCLHKMALKYFNEILAINEKDSRGYMGRLLCKYECVSTEQLLKKFKKPLVDNFDFNNALNCGDEHQETYIELAAKQEEEYSNRRLRRRNKRLIFLKLIFFTFIALLPILVCYYTVSLGNNPSIITACALIVFSLILRRKYFVKRCVWRINSLVGIPKRFRFYAFVLGLVYLGSIGFYLYTEIKTATLYDVKYSYIFNEVKVTGYKKSQSPYELTTLVIPSSIEGRKITRIKNDAFAGATQNIIMNLNSNIKVINPCFRNYAGKSIQLPNNIREIEAEAFMGAENLREINLPVGLKSIGKSAFRDCENLLSITIPDSVTLIDDYAFYNCKKIQSVTIPSNLTKINKYSFSLCGKLETLIIPTNIIVIEEHAFSFCYTLQTITIPNSVTSIEKYAFYNCYGLNSIYIPTSIDYMGEYVFASCLNLTIYYQGSNTQFNWHPHWNRIYENSDQAVSVIYNHN